MPDVQIDNVVRAQCIWSGPSGLPRDRYVTTWHFVRGSGSALSDAQEQADEVSERLREFWLENTSVGQSVAAYLSPNVLTAGLEIRCYDLGQPAGTANGSVPPREARIYNHEADVSALGSKNLPEEVAVSLSFYADRNLPRRRGRVFIGPLSDAAVKSSGPARVDNGFQRTLCAAAHRLANEEGATDVMRMGVLSQKDQEIRQVTAGWVDDAFDTIRKRGPESTGREPFPGWST